MSLPLIQRVNESLDESCFDEPVCSFDSETTGLDPYLGARPFLWITCTADDGPLLAWVPGHELHVRRDWRVTVDRLRDPHLRKVGHNVKFDLKMARYSGVEVAGVAHCTMLMATLVNEYEKSHALKYLAAKYLQADGHEEAELLAWFQKNAYRLRQEYGKGKWKRYDAVPREIMEPYARADGLLTLKLYYMYSGMVQENHYANYLEELRFLPSLARVEDRGHLVDVSYFKKARKKADARLAGMQEELRSLCCDSEFNPSSPPQVGRAMRGIGLASPIKTKTGADSWGKDALAAVDHPIARGVLGYRGLAKLASTYYGPMAERGALLDGVIHPTFWQVGSKGERSVVTGRLSSSDPNFQNIPRRDLTVRRGFVCRPGFRIYYFDYKQVEMAIFACYSQDPHMLRMARDGVDLHEGTAALLFGGIWGQLRADKAARKFLRQVAKTINFGILYGMGVKKLVQSLRELLVDCPPHIYEMLDIPRTGVSEEWSKGFLGGYHRRFPSIHKFSRRMMWEVERQGYVSDVFGRRYHVPSDLRYKAVNALVQGAAAGVMKRGVTRVDRLLEGRRSGIVNLVHDDTQVEVHGSERSLVPLIREALEDRSTFEVPLAVDVGWTDSNWADKRGLLRSA